jgi:uncharacterized membrane protein YcaP (DUF421 family)
MGTVIRGITIYLVLLLIFRISGKRTLAQTTPFDLILTLIISEAVQQAMLDGDDSLTNGVLLVMTLIGFDIILSLVKQRSDRIAKILEGTPVVVMENGEVNEEFMRRERIDESDLIEAGRELHGLKKVDEIDYAVLEMNGQITVVPRKKKNA